MPRTSTAVTDIRSRIEAFLDEITTLVRQSALEAVRGALGDGAAPARRGPGRPRGSTKTAKTTVRRARGKRSSEDVDALAQRMASYVRTHPGQGVEAISKGMGVPTKELKLPVIKLLAAKSLRTTGQRRGTKYFAGGRGGTGRVVMAKKAKGKGRRKAGRKSARKMAGRQTGTPSAAQPQKKAAA